MDLKTNCQEGHGPLRLPRGALSLFHGTIRKAYGAQGKCNMGALSLPRFAKSGIFVRSLRLVLGVSVTLSTTASLCLTPGVWMLADL